MSHGPVRNLGHLFQQIVALHANRPAIRFATGESVSYRALDAAANRMARLLIAEGVGHGDVVCLLNSKRLAGFAAMLSCLKLGAIHVNLDEENPGERAARILERCRPSLILADSPPPAVFADACAGLSIPLIDASTAELHARLAAMQDGDLAETAAVTSDDPAYVMFTSGSTGFPKGAVIRQGSLLNFIAWTRRRFGITPGEVLTNVNPMYFDNSVFDFYAALFSGACLAPFPREVVKDPRALVSAVEAAGCTIWFSVPSLLIYLMATKTLIADRLASLRCFVFGGEGYPKTELKKLFDLYGERARFVNVYGPTEGTCICSAHDVTEADFSNLDGLPPLGPITEDFDYLLLDAQGRQVKTGEPGELCLLGAQVGSGYYNDPERTRESFTANPLDPEDRRRMYRTGDLVREDESGLLHFVGRRDNQIKHMGYRIELEEIEAAISRVPAVRQAAVVYQRTDRGYGRIVAFLAASEGSDEAVIRGALGTMLPGYMIPNRIEVLADLPKNANGKVDRALLATR